MSKIIKIVNKINDGRKEEVMEMREISRDKLVKEYELVINKVRNDLVTKEMPVDISFKYAKNDNEYTRDMTILCVDFLESIITNNNYEARKILCSLIEKPFIKYNLNGVNKKNIIDNVLDEARKERIELKRHIEDAMVKKDIYREKLDNGEISTKEYNEYVDNIVKNECTLLKSSTRTIASKLNQEVENTRSTMKMDMIFGLIACVVEIIILLFKNIKNKPKENKNVVLAAGKEAVIIRQNKNNKTIDNTKILLPCINNTKTLNNNISLNI